MAKEGDSKRLLPAAPKDESDRGHLRATILSAYDLPDNAQPSFVSLSLLGKDVQTGPPNARHRESNSFKFVSNEKEGSKNGESSGDNEVSISAPLELLYEEEATVKVLFENHEALVAKVNLSSTLQINESKWLILNLEPESVAGKSTSSELPEKSEDGTDQHPPTVRLKLLLSGPYRAEIKAVVSLANSWFQVIDSTSSTISSMTSKLPLPSKKMVLVPTVPLAAASVVLLPILLGLLTVGLPFFLPVLIILLAVGATAIVGCSGLYLSSSTGRETAARFLQPIMSTFIATSSGQKLLYETGPRPSPVALSETILPDDMIGQLIVSLLIDFIGSSSYLLPGVGESFDLGWAPMQTVLLMAMYDKQMPSLKYISFIEEIMPFTDVLPSGTLGWVRRWSPLVFEAGIKKAEEMKIIPQMSQKNA